MIRVRIEPGWRWPRMRRSRSWLTPSWSIRSSDAKKIDRLIWKYRAMVRIAFLAADSQQYSRGVELARGIENGESRAEAMLILAESQCRPGVNQNEAATIDLPGGGRSRRHDSPGRAARCADRLPDRQPDFDRPIR